MDFVISPFLSTSFIIQAAQKSSSMNVPKSVFPRGALETLCLQEDDDGSGMAMDDGGVE